MIDDEKRVSRELGVSAERLPLRIAVTLLPGTSLVLVDSSFVVRDGRPCLFAEGLRYPVR
jgi:hypothetical protein